AAQAGLRAGDVITAANGQPIGGRDALRNFEGLQALGSRVTLAVLREGKPVTLQIGLKEQPRSIAGAEFDPRLAGATFSELPANLRNSGLSGVLVESVARGSRAAQNGLQAGDVVIAATTGAVDDIAAFRAGFTRQPADLALRVMRGGQQGVLPMR
ncbi:PDZ domain-containing protein, partial [Cognatilysobacter lacus]